MDRVEIVRVVPDLDVPFRVRTHEDGTQSVDVRAGLPLMGSVATLINQLYFQRARAASPTLRQRS